MGDFNLLLEALSTGTFAELINTGYSTERGDYFSSREGQSPAMMFLGSLSCSKVFVFLCYFYFFIILMHLIRW